MRLIDADKLEAELHERLCHPKKPTQSAGIAAAIKLVQKQKTIGDIMIKEIDKSVKALVDANGGYCPCAIVKDADTKCMCKEFREMEQGVCHCGRFEKRADNE